MRYKAVAFIIAFVAGLAQVAAYPQEYSKNEITIGIGESIPTTSDFHTEDHSIDEENLNVKQDQLSYQLEYSRFFRKNLALRFVFRKASFKGDRSGSQWWPISASHNITAYSLNVGISYYFDSEKDISPFMGGGINIMTARTADNYRFRTSILSKEVLTPVSHTNVGPVIFTGILWKFSEKLAMKVESEYAYNGFSMKKWDYEEDGHKSILKETGTKRLKINPLTISMGISVKW